jgi:mRNA interferase HigB
MFFLRMFTKSQLGTKVCSMRIIAKRSLMDFLRRHPTARQSVLAWCDEVHEANWAGPQDIKERYVTASFVENNRVIFNLKGNSYRLVIGVAYRVGVIYVKFIGTHAEYDGIQPATVEME